MTFLQWEPACSVRVQQFDEEHRRLFDMINELHHAMDTGQERPVLRKVLYRMLDHARSHFKAEEDAMRRTSYAGLHLHTEEHHHLTLQLQNLIALYEHGETGITLHVLYFLRDWAQDHILDSDRKYSDHLNANGVH